MDHMGWRPPNTRKATHHHTHKLSPPMRISSCCPSAFPNPYCIPQAVPPSCPSNPSATSSLSPQSLLLVHGFDDGGGSLRCGPTTDGKHVDDHDRHVLETVVEGHGESIHRTLCAQHTVQTDLLGGEVNGCGRVRGGDESLQHLSCFNK